MSKCIIISWHMNIIFIDSIGKSVKKNINIIIIMKTLLW